jgi:hypothetical protein
MVKMSQAVNPVSNSTLPAVISMPKFVKNLSFFNQKGHTSSWSLSKGEKRQF